MERKKWIAAVLGLTMPGMGQIYNGELLKGVSLLVVFLGVFVTGFRLTVLFPDYLLIIGAALTLLSSLLIWLFAIIEAYKKARKIESLPKSYNRWYFYAAVWILGSGFIMNAAYDYTKTNIIEAYKIEGVSMEPSVLKGDRVFVDKTAYMMTPPKKDDIIVFIFPDDRSKMYIKRIAGLPGDTIDLTDEKKETVPHGLIYVLGDNREQSIDSREFGFIPLRDVIGKARQIYYSSGSKGTRWNRIGMTLGGRL